MKDPRTDHDAGRLGRPGRRRQRGGLAAGAVVVAVATVLVPQWLNGVRTSTLEPAGPAKPALSTSRVTAGPSWRESDPTRVSPCPARPVDIDVSGDVDGLRNGALSVRLCPATAGGAVTPWRPPLDALVTGLDGFLEALDAVSTADPDRCAAIRAAPEPYVYRLDFPGDHVETVPVTSICSDVLVNGRPLAAAEVLERFDAALSAQRRNLDPPEDLAVAAECGELPGEGDSRLLDGHSVVLAAAVVCRVERLDGVTKTHQLRRLAPDQRAVIEADLARNVRAGEPFIEGCQDSEGLRRVVLVTSWGDLLRFEQRAAECGADGVWASAGYSWRPGPAARRILLD